MAAGRDSGTSGACWPLPSSKCSGRPCLKELGWGDEAGFQHAHTPKKHLQLFSCSDCFWFSLVRETQCLIQHQVHDKYSGSATSQSLDQIWIWFGTDSRRTFANKQTYTFTCPLLPSASLEQRHYHLCQLLYWIQTPGLVTPGLAPAFSTAVALHQQGISVKMNKSFHLWEFMNRFILYSSWTAHSVGVIITWTRKSGTRLKK